MVEVFFRGVRLEVDVVLERCDLAKRAFCGIVEKSRLRGDKCFSVAQLLFQHGGCQSDGKSPFGVEQKDSTERSALPADASA